MRGGGRGRGRGGGRGGKGSDKTINMPDLMGQTMSEVGAGSMYHATHTDKPAPLFPPTYVKRFTWEEKEVDQGAELYMMKKMVALEDWTRSSPYNLDATPADGLPQKARAEGQSTARASQLASNKRLLAFVADVKYTDLYSKDVVSTAREALAGLKRMRAGSGLQPAKKLTAALALLGSAAAEGEGLGDDEVGADGVPLAIGEGGEDEDEEADEESEEDFNDYTEFHDDDGDDDEGGGGGDGGDY